MEPRCLEAGNCAGKLGSALQWAEYPKAVFILSKSTTVLPKAMLLTSSAAFGSRRYTSIEHGTSPNRRSSSQLACRCTARADDPQLEPLSRRGLLVGTSAVAAAVVGIPSPAAAVVQGYAPMPALKDKDYGKSRMTYSDYVKTDTGLQYQDLRVGSGESPKPGQTAVVDWSGVTIGYYGRPFEARNKAKGGAFTGDEKDFFRFKLGESGVVPAFNEAVAGMKVGGVRRIIVPPEIGYPNNDLSKAQPAPSTFSGRRALSFVLENQGFIDKTLLFDIELIKVG